MGVLLFTLYGAVLSLVIVRSGFFARSGLSKKMLVSLFLLYALAGCLHLVIAYRLFPNHGDVWEIFQYSVRYKEQLLHDYPAFRQEFFPDRFSVDLTGDHLGWSYYQLQWLAALQMLFNFLSFDNIYINTLLFCFLTMYGKVALYRVLRKRYPLGGTVALVLVFLIPSVLFWTSVIHKEGVLLCGLGILLYCMQNLLSPPSGGRRKSRMLNVAGVGLCLLLIFITRKVVLMTLVPGLIIWWMAQKTSLRLKRIVPTVCILYALLLAAAGLLGPSYNLLHLLSGRQQEFLELRGGSEIFVPKVDTTVASFARAFPFALLNGLFMPLPGWGGKSVYLLFSVEIMAAWALLAWCVVKKRVLWDGYTAALLLFALASCLIIGYIVPFAGALVRYRSIFYPFLLAPFLLNEPFILWPKSSLKKRDYNL